MRSARARRSPSPRRARSTHRERGGDHDRDSARAPRLDAAASRRRHRRCAPIRISAASGKERTWRFRKRQRPRPDAATPPLAWLRALARWLAEGGRASSGCSPRSCSRSSSSPRGAGSPFTATAVGTRGARLPSHVRELDIRPESLPADIGAAVRELWLAGERRAALSLLYRGALSRLVHSYQVAIGDASTEGDCVRLARAALPPPRGDFVTALVDAWQLAVYGGRPLATEHVLRLCADFDRLLPAVATGAPGAEAGRR